MWKYAVTRFTLKRIHVFNFFQNLKARKKSFPKDLPHRPETVGAHMVGF